VVTVTACSEYATASGGQISWTGADSHDTLFIDGGGIPLITLFPIAASGSYGPLEGGAYTYEFVDNTDELLSGTFRIPVCPAPNAGASSASVST
jgi:hypothetical protein